MAAERNTTHIARGLEKILGQHQDKPIIKALVTSYLRRTQRVEDMAHDVAGRLNIDAGEGWILDAIGRIIGRGRSVYANDAIYRIALRAQIAINRSRGRVRDIVEVGRLSFGTVVVRDYPPASYTATLAEQIDAYSAIPFLENMAAVRPLGVRGFAIISTEAPMAESLIWGSVTDAGTGTAWGTAGDLEAEGVARSKILAPNLPLESSLRWSYPRGAPAPHTRDL